jgi:hypothetical protein
LGRHRLEGKPLVSDLDWDSLELELRQIPGVMGVGLGERGGTLVVTLLVEDVPAAATARRHAEELVRSHVDGPASVLVETTGRPVPPTRGPRWSERVRLVAVQVPERDDEVEVHLSHRGTRVVGRSPRSDAKGAVLATMEALQGLGARVPFRVRAVVPVTAEGETAMVVVLSGPEAEVGEASERMGVARGATAAESACRATLHALNRFLSEERAFPAWLAAES